MIQLPPSKNLPAFAVRMKQKGELMISKMLCASALLLGLSLSVFCQGTQDAPDKEHTRQTRYGLIEVKQSPADNTKFQISLNGRKVHEYQGESVEINNIFQDGNKVFAVVGQNSGGSGCPYQFVIIEISGPKSLNVSEDFGSCSDLAKSTMTNGRLIVEMPSWPCTECPESEKRRLSKTIEVYTWGAGKLTHTTKPRPRRWA